MVALAWLKRTMSFRLDADSVRNWKSAQLNNPAVYFVTQLKWWLKCFPKNSSKEVLWGNPWVTHSFNLDFCWDELRVSSQRELTAQTYRAGCNLLHHVCKWILLPAVGELTLRQGSPWAEPPSAPSEDLSLHHTGLLPIQQILMFWGIVSKIIWATQPNAV